jgi:hypothetical protein
MTMILAEGERHKKTIYDILSSVSGSHGYLLSFDILIS